MNYWPFIAPCSCGLDYTAAEWARLPRCGVMPDGAGGHLELRQCRCGSTIATKIKIQEDPVIHPYQTRQAEWLTHARRIVADTTDLLNEMKADLSDGIVDIGSLEGLAAYGNEAGQLHDEIEQADTCGCSDPGCPCDGPKREGPP